MQKKASQCTIYPVLVDEIFSGGLNNKYEAHIYYVIFWSYIFLFVNLDDKPYYNRTLSFYLSFFWSKLCLSI